MPDRTAAHSARLGSRPDQHERGYLVGSFDLLNVAHLDVIDQALETCGSLVVGVLSDEQVARTSGRPPVVPFDERMELVKHVRGVGGVVEHGSDAQLALDSSIALVTDAEEPPDWSGGIRLEPRKRTSSVLLLAASVPAGARAEAG